MMPPEKITPAELWSEVTKMPRPHRIVDFPRYDAEGKSLGQLAIRALTQAEQIDAGIRAEKLVRAELPNANQDTSIGYNVAYSNAASVEQLWRACRDPNDLERPVFPSPKEMRAHLTGDELGVLYAAFLDVCSEIGPIIGALTSEEQEAWIDRLVKGGEASDPLPSFSSRTLMTLVRSMAARLRTSPTAPASPGSPPDELASGGSDDSLTEET